MSTTFIPCASTKPKGEKPCPSSPALSFRLMKICVERVLGMLVFAYVRYPRLLVCVTGSSLMLAFSDAEETGVVIEVVFHKIVEAVGPNRGPRTIHGDNKVSPCSHELHLKRLRCFVLQHRRAKKCAVIPLLGHRCRRARRGFGFRRRRSRNRSRCFRFWLRGSLGLRLLRRWRLGSLFFRLASEE